MRLARLLARVVPVAAVAFLVAPAGVGSAPPPAASAPASPSSKPFTGADVEVRYSDDSNMKLKLLDEKLELTTRHGVLRIAASEVRKIEFATRVPTEVAEKVASAIGRLGHADFKVREEATEELKAFRERAYSQLLKAVKSDDPEVKQRAEDVVKFIRARVPAALLDVREFDVVHTEDSKNTGRLTGEFLRVGTYQYGELRLKLCDVHSLRSLLAPKPEDLIAAVPAPANMTGHANQPGKEFAFTVTGALGGAVYGTDVYTTDTSLATAVVHAGLAKAGETVTVRVRVLGAVPQFVSSTRNGVTSSAYGQYSGYEFVRK